MSDFDLSETDPAMDLGHKVLWMLGDGYDGEQITRECGVTPTRALEALTAYASRVLYGTAPERPSPECGVSTYNGWCFVHGVFHVAAGGAA